MNEFETPSAMQIDRLVNGALTESERRELLVALERQDCSETCGWRQLALAFVEAQTLRQDLRGFAVERNADAVEVDVTQTRNPFDPALLSQNRQAEIRTGDTPANAAKAMRPMMRSSRKYLAVLAACCVIAFATGLLLNRGDRKPLSTATDPQPNTFVETPLIDHRDPGEMAMGFSSTGQPYETLHVVLDDPSGGPMLSRTVPVVTEAIDPASLLNGPPSIPLSVQRALLRQGRIVREHRQLVDVELSDGRHGVMPISDVRVINAGSDVFQ